jgi:hypothetical protein
MKRSINLFILISYQFSLVVRIDVLFFNFFRIHIYFLLRFRLGVFFLNSFFGKKNYFASEKEQVFNLINLIIPFLSFYQHSHIIIRVISYICTENRVKFKTMIYYYKLFSLLRILYILKTRVSENRMFLKKRIALYYKDTMLHKWTLLLFRFLFTQILRILYYFCSSCCYYEKFSCYIQSECMFCLHRFYLHTTI